MNRVDESGYYDGSRVFSFLVEPLGLTVDQVCIFFWFIFKM